MDNQCKYKRKWENTYFTALKNKVKDRMRNNALQIMKLQCLLDFQLGVDSGKSSNVESSIIRWDNVTQMTQGSCIQP